MGSTSSTGWIESLTAGKHVGPALVFGGREVGAVELARAARQTLGCLDGLGVEAGDVLGVLAPPSIEGVALVHALLDRGIVLMPLNARLAEPEQRLALEASGARFLVVSTASEDALARRLAENAGCGLLRLETFDDASPISGVCSPEVSRASELFAHRERRLAESAALVVRTSGTSGQPKGAVLGLDNLKASADASAALLTSRSSDRWLLCMPLFHIGGLSILFRSARGGETVLLQDRFDPIAVSRSLEEEGVTHVSLVATMLERLLEARGVRRAPTSLRCVLLGGGPASASLIARAEALGYPIAPTYGLTEAASQVATWPPHRGMSSRSSELEALPGLELRIVDDRGRVLGPDQEGEIQLRGPTVMRGYLDDPVATLDALRDGWLSTGDVGRLDRAGRLGVLDRRADLIVSGGENIYPAEIERVLGEHPDIAEAGACGVSDERFGARPTARVVMRPGRPFDRQELLAFCRTRLAAYKCPVDLAPVASLPRNATGKLMRRRLLDPQKDGEVSAPR